MLSCNSRLAAVASTFNDPSMNFLHLPMKSCTYMRKNKLCLFLCVAFMLAVASGQADGGIPISPLGALALLIILLLLFGIPFVFVTSKLLNLAGSVLDKVEASKPANKGANRTAGPVASDRSHDDSE